MLLMQTTFQKEAGGLLGSIGIFEEKKRARNVTGRSQDMHFEALAGSRTLLFVMFHLETPSSRSANELPA
jgi:hypothetical protein